MGYSWRVSATGGSQATTRVGSKNFSHGIEYAHPDGVGQLLRRRKVKLKTGRPRHEDADPDEQEDFKKSSLAR